MTTRDSILASATQFVRTRGYHGFSYADLATVVGIRKASIHHHFPNKSDLGAAIVDGYTEQFRVSLEAISSEVGSTARKLRAYSDLYRNSLVNDLGCLCGVLASDIDVIPASVGVGVRTFMALNLSWLADTLRTGQRTNELPKSLDVDSAAQVLLSICQGALLVSRTNHDVAGFDRTVDAAQSALFTRVGP